MWKAIYETFRTDGILLLKRFLKQKNLAFCLLLVRHLSTVIQKKLRHKEAPRKNLFSGELYISSKYTAGNPGHACMPVGGMPPSFLVLMYAPAYLRIRTLSIDTLLPFESITFFPLQWTPFAATASFLDRSLVPGWMTYRFLRTVTRPAVVFFPR